MPRRKANETAVSRLSNGMHRRYLGTYVAADGKLKPKAFNLGRDEKQAIIRNLRLEALWEQVVADFEKQRQINLQRFDTLQAGGDKMLRSPEDRTPITREELENEKPRWAPQTLPIAEAVRQGQAHVVIPQQPGECDAMYAERLAELGRRFPGFVFVPDDAEALEAGRAAHAGQAVELTEQAAESAGVAGVAPPVAATGQTLHEALEAYAAEQAEKDTEHARIEAAWARRIRTASPEMDLSTFGVDALRAMVQYWAARPEAKLPNGKPSGRAITVPTVERAIKTLRRFVNWLDEREAYTWELPRHAAKAVKVNLSRLRTRDEVASGRHGPQTFTIEQLVIIWKHASDSERLLVLLGLNACMSQAEIVGFRWDELEGNVIKRIRHKSGVYGEFKLWPESQTALSWWKRVRGRKGNVVMTTKLGNAYTRQRIANQWVNLRERVERETGETLNWWLPFKHLRKTAAQLVREASDGEIAGVFLSHGQPVQSDELSDVYTRRPFDKVAAALDQVRAKLSPMFAAADDAFISRSTGGRGPKPRLRQ